MKIKKISGIETHALQIIKEIRSLFAETIDIQSLANGMVGTFRHEDGNTYEVTVKTVEEEPSFRDINLEDFDIRQNKSVNEIRTAQPSENYRRLMDSLDEGNPAKIEPVIHLITSSEGNLVPKTDFDREKLDLVIGRHEFNRFPESVREIAKKLKIGRVGRVGFDRNMTYELIVDGKNVEKYISEFQKRL